MNFSLVRKMSQLANLTLVILMTTSCKEDLPLRVHVQLDSPEVEAEDVTQVSIGGRKATFEKRREGQMRGDPAYIEPGSNLPAGTPMTVTFLTACGAKTITLPMAPPNERNLAEMLIKGKDLPPKTTLVVDPLAEGVIIGTAAVANPTPKRLDVRLADCPNPVTVAGHPIELPPMKARDMVLIAASPQSCYVKGTLWFGGQGCPSDTSERLTGKAAYHLGDGISYIFEGVPSSVTVSKGTKCVPRTFLSYCD